MSQAVVIENVSKIFVRTRPPQDRRAHLLGRWRKQTRRVVDQVSLAVGRGEIVGIVGPNGSGKSTLVRMIATLLLPDEGTIRVFDRDVVKEAGAVKRMINRVAADAAFFRNLSVMENLMYSARMYGLRPGPARDGAERILEELGFPTRRLSERVRRLSRGMQQKVAIARAFLTAPVLLLLDEPTTGLDPKSKREVHAFIARLREVHDATLLLTTHDMEEADKLCDRIMILDRGRSVAMGAPAELKTRCQSDDGMPTMEEVFLQLTGHKLDEESEDEDDDE
jgi:ABC-2 type transport system ATP-binding protein